MMKEHIKSILTKYINGSVKFNEPMSNHSSIKIGSKCLAYIEPTSVNDLKKSIRVLNQLNLDYYVVGACTNILFYSNLSNKCFISTSKLSAINVNIKNQTLECMAGDKLSRVYMAAMQSGLSGFEALAQIPGTVGGAIINNAGAFGTEIKDLLKSVKILTPSGRIKEVGVSDLGLSYRHSNIKSKGWIILSAVFKLKILAPSVIRSMAVNYAMLRQSSQPIGYSLGSVFKKTQFEPAGKLIDDCGLKGFKIGDCVVSNVHANFILNLGQGKATDFKKLVSVIQKQVKNKFNILLDREVEYI